MHPPGPECTTYHTLHYDCGHHSTEDPRAVPRKCGNPQCPLVHYHIHYPHPCQYCKLRSVKYDEHLISIAGGDAYNKEHAALIERYQYALCHAETAKDWEQIDQLELALKDLGMLRGSVDRKTYMCGHAYTGLWKKGLDLAGSKCGLCVQREERHAERIGKVRLGRYEVEIS